MDKTPDSSLLIFSKYPLARKAKTRLIPALGAEVAAQLHRRLAESAIEMARSWSRETSKSTSRVIIHYTGAGEEIFCNWLGSDLDYQKQPAGDLGQRMYAAFKSAFKCGIGHAIGIGTDVPPLTAVILQQADKTLKDHDLVLDPASSSFPGGQERYMVSRKKKRL